MNGSTPEIKKQIEDLQISFKKLSEVFVLNSELIKQISKGLTSLGEIITKETKVKTKELNESFNEYNKTFDQINLSLTRYKGHLYEIYKQHKYQLKIQQMLLESPSAGVKNLLIQFQKLKKESPLVYEQAKEILDILRTSAIEFEKEPKKFEILMLRLRNSFGKNIDAIYKEIGKLSQKEIIELNYRLRQQEEAYENAKNKYLGSIKNFITEIAGEFPKIGVFAAIIQYSNIENTLVQTQLKFRFALDQARMSYEDFTNTIRNSIVTWGTPAEKILDSIVSLSRFRITASELFTIIPKEGASSIEAMSRLSHSIDYSTEEAASLADVLKYEFGMNLNEVNKSLGEHLKTITILNTRYKMDTETLNTMTSLYRRLSSQMVFYRRVGTTQDELNYRLTKMNNALAKTIKSFREVGISASEAQQVISNLLDPERLEDNLFILSRFGISMTEALETPEEALMKISGGIQNIGRQLMSMDVWTRRAHLQLYKGLPPQLFQRLSLYSEGKTEEEINKIMSLEDALSELRKQHLQSMRELAAEGVRSLNSLLTALTPFMDVLKGIFHFIVNIIKGFSSFVVNLQKNPFFGTLLKIATTVYAITFAWKAIKFGLGTLFGIPAIHKVLTEIRDTLRGGGGVSGGGLINNILSLFKKGGLEKFFGGEMSGLFGRVGGAIGRYATILDKITFGRSGLLGEKIAGSWFGRLIGLNKILGPLGAKVLGATVVTWAATSIISGVISAIKDTKKMRDEVFKLKEGEKLTIGHRIAYGVAKTLQAATFGLLPEATTQAVARGLYSAGKKVYDFLKTHRTLVASAFFGPGAFLTTTLVTTLARQGVLGQKIKNFVLKLEGDVNKSSTQIAKSLSTTEKNLSKTLGIPIETFARTSKIFSEKLKVDQKTIDTMYNKFSEMAIKSKEAKEKIQWVFENKKVEVLKDIAEYVKQDNKFNELSAMRLIAVHKTLDDIRNYDVKNPPSALGVLAKLRSKEIGEPAGRIALGVLA